MRAHPSGGGVALIGPVRADTAGLVLLRTAFGGTRIVDVLSAISCRGSPDSLRGQCGSWRRRSVSRAA
jgi:hypothetical protein